MSGTYPTSPTFNAVKFISRVANVRSETESLRTQTRSLGGQRFEFSAKYPKLTQSQWATVDSFLMQQDGSKETFQIVLPVISTQQGSATGTVLVNGAHSKGVRTIAVTGLTGTIAAGSVIKFDSHTKVYKVVADLTGAGNLTIRPGLMQALVDLDPVAYDDVPFTVRQKGDTQEFDIEPGVFYSYEVDMVEDI